MVNWVEAQKPLIHALAKYHAGLRPTIVEVDSGTVMSLWAPKYKVIISKKAKKNDNLIAPEVNKTTNNNNIESTSPKSAADKKTTTKGKPSVVLVHGFAAEGLSTWEFQIGPLSSAYDVYVPDLLFFGESTTSSTDRSPEFQARCLAAALKKLGVERCTLVGFSYGGMVAFKLAEAFPGLVEALVISGSIIAMTDSISETTMQRLGFSSSSELLLPESVKGLKALLSIATYKKLWFPEFLYRDYLEVMFNNRKERAELLEGLVISNKDAFVPALSQRILLLWGENDVIFNIELAKHMKEQLGEKATLQAIPKAGHLVHIERPCVYTCQLKEFLSLVYPKESKA